jgi:tRNA threonylcarbamoyladenosine biosynthesis protein TsaB
MRVLAVDAATEKCSVALLSGGEIIGRSAHGARPHGQQILGMVEEVLAEAELSLSMLDGIAASVGPGAFTGVRISVAVAQGLAFGADLAVIPVTTLEALAWQVLRGGGIDVLACLDARMSEVYFGWFAADAARGLIASAPAHVGPPDTVQVPARGVYRGIGRGFAAYPALGRLPGLKLDPEDAQALPDAGEFAALGALRLKLGEGQDPAGLTPLYLRDKVALTEAERAAK